MDGLRGAGGPVGRFCPPFCPGWRPPRARPLPASPKPCALAAPQGRTRGSSPRVEVPWAPLHPTEVPTPTRPQLLHKSMTYLQPAPDGPAPCQPAARRRAKGRRGRCQTGAGQRDLCAQAAGRARRAGARPAEPRPPLAAAPSARHPRAEPRLRWAWGSPPQLLGTPALSGPCTRMRIPHTCAITLMHTQHTHTHAHTYT